MPMPADLKAILDNISKNGGNSSRPDVPRMPEVFTAEQLQTRSFPEPVWVIPGIIPEGVTLLAGKPKTGKSYLAANIALAKALGGRAFGAVEVESQGVLYLSLEDRERRLQSRIGLLLADDCIKWPANLHMAINWPRADQGGITLLQQWLEDHPDVKLVIVDTLKKIRGRQGGNRNAYDVEYEQIEYLKNIADTMNVSILIVHHLRKLEGDDAFDSISGSTGISAAVDTGMILKAERGKGKLYIRGRDIEEQELVLDRDPSGGWRLLGDAGEVARSEEQAEVLSFMEGSDRPVKLKDICAATGKRNNSVHKLLAKLVHQGLVVQPMYGFYALRKRGERGESGECSRQTLMQQAFKIHPSVSGRGESLREVADKNSESEYFQKRTDSSGGSGSSLLAYRQDSPPSPDSPHSPDSFYPPSPSHSSDSPYSLHSPDSPHPPSSLGSSHSPVSPDSIISLDSPDVPDFFPSLDSPHIPHPSHTPQNKCIDCFSFQVAGKPNLAGLCTGDPYDGYTEQFPQLQHDCEGFLPR